MMYGKVLTVVGVLDGQPLFHGRREVLPDHPVQCE